MEPQDSNKSNEDNSRLAEECAKLDPQVEQAMAEEGMVQDVATWPDYLIVRKMRGFLEGIDTTVERESDRV
jgi:hypothetical protein